MARTPIHPGEILADELQEIGIAAAVLARALRLARYFGTSADFWMNLQKTYELDVARKELGTAIQHIPRRQGTEAHF
jgi:plasmid maintenance system antidote protein VapI